MATGVEHDALQQPDGRSSGCPFRQVAAATVRTTVLSVLIYLTYVVLTHSQPGGSWYSTSQFGIVRQPELSVRMPVPSTNGAVGPLEEDPQHPSPVPVAQARIPPPLGMRALLNSSLAAGISWQAPGIACFRYSNEVERTTYHATDAFIACFVEDLCVENNEWTIPALPDDTNRTSMQPNPFDGNGEGTAVVVVQSKFITIRRRSGNASTDIGTGLDSVSLPPPLGEQLALFGAQFASENLFHTTLEMLTPAFQAAASVGLYDTCSHALRTASVRVFIVAAAMMRSQPFASLWRYVTSHPVETDVPAQPFCVKLAWVGLPFAVTPDGRWEGQAPKIPTICKPEFMLWGQTIVHSVLAVNTNESATAHDAAAQAGPAVTETPSQPLACECALHSAHCSDEVSLITELNHQLIVENTQGRGTRVLYIRRASRRAVNQDAIVASADRELQKLNCPFTAVHFNSSLSMEEQIQTVMGVTVLISEHGASLAHGQWLPKGAVILELAARDNIREWFSELAADFQLTFMRHVNMGEELHGEDPLQRNFLLVEQEFVQALRVAVNQSIAVFGAYRVK